MTRRLILYYIYLSIIIGAMSPVACAEVEPSDGKYVFYKASSYYELGDYENAISEYEHFLTYGKESGNLYYNLGNCYFKQGEMGKALLYYERARRLMPRDGDLAANYRYARSLVKAAASDERKMWFFRIKDYFFEHFSVNELTLLLSFLFVLIIMLAAGMFVFKSGQSYYRVVLAVGALIFIIGLFALSDKINRIHTEGIVIVEETSAKFEPFERATTHFTLSEGMKIVVVQSKDEWIKIRRRDGKSGWILGEKVEMI